MMNEDNDKTAVRTRRMPFRAAPEADSEHGANVLPPGTHLGEFEILDLIGEGGFGIVYLAYDHSLERHVALKEYMPSGLATRKADKAVTVRSQHNAATFTAGLRSFINEARMLAQFDSPALVKVHRFWEGNGTAYMVMPFYDGITLKQALKERRINPTENWLRLLLSDLFDAIDTIHQAQCFHRDIAPDNILLLKDGRPLLLDFGAARRVIGDLTQCLTVILKPGFAPIEQYADIAGLRQGAWTDIYALAAVVYYVITGRAPPPAVARMVHDEMVPARDAGKGRYSEAFLKVLDKALSVKPEQRYRSVAEMRRALDIMDTVPRTMPGTISRWSTTAIPTTRIAEPKAEPVAAPDAEPATEWHPSHHSEPPSLSTGKSANLDKPAWAILGVLLTTGIAAGVYFGTHNPWRAPAAPQVASSGTSARVESSGSSGAPEEEPTPPPPVATPVPPPPAPAPVQAQHEAVPPSSPPQNAAVDRKPSKEEELWRSVSRSDKASAYERYLKEYPQGLYAAVAKLRLDSKQPKTKETAAKLAAPPAPEKTPAKAPAAIADARTKAAKPATPSPSPEEELWKTAAAINEPAAYEAYLHQYPRGGFAPIARDRLASLKRAASAAPTVASSGTPPAQTEAERKPPAPEPAPADLGNKQASINPKPTEPLPATTSKAVEVPKPAETQSKAPTKTEPEPSTVEASTSKKSLVLGDQTMSGDFSIDPKTGIVSGAVKIVWTNGNQFEGRLVHGLKEGQGRFSWANGQRYSGDWAHDQPNGRGTIVFPNGNRYEGEVKDGVPHGRGTTRFKDGDVYTGSWAQGKMQGHGRYTWANGSYWDGEFSNDKQTENGKMVFAENAIPRSSGSSGGGEVKAPDRIGVNGAAGK